MTNLLHRDDWLVGESSRMFLEEIMKEWEIILGLERGFLRVLWGYGSVLWAIDGLWEWDNNMRRIIMQEILNFKRK